jgi:hypothetical protein
MLRPNPACALAQRSPFALSPVREGTGGRLLALYQSGPLKLLAHMRQQLCVAEPAVTWDDRRGPRSPTATEGRQLIKHGPHPAQVVAAGGSGAAGLRPSHDQVTGPTSLPSPVTPTRQSPSRPESTRLGCPLPQRPMRPICGPYFGNTASSIAHIHGHRLCGDGLLVSPWRHHGTNPASPKCCSRLSHERWGSPRSRREGQCLSQPRTRQSAVGMRQPKSAGYITPTIWPRRVCWLRKRPTLSATTVSGSPKSSRA